MNAIFYRKQALSLPGKKYNRKCKTKPCQTTGKTPFNKVLWGSFSFKSVGSLFPVPEMMKSDRYIENLQRRSIPGIQKAFSADGVIFQRKSAPCHSKKVKKFFSDNSITVLEWPEAPDLDPVENLWAVIKWRLREQDCHHKQAD